MKCDEAESESESKAETVAEIICAANPFQWLPFFQQFSVFRVEACFNLSTVEIACQPESSCQDC